MIRNKVTPRKDYISKIEKLGFNFHTISDEKYWDENVNYAFNSKQIDELETATNELYEMCINAVQYVIDNNLYSQFEIDRKFVPLIENGWNNELPSIYGRFDFAYDGINPPKMLEFNADTPTSLFEASVIQWDWLGDTNKTLDQFNSIHEKLINYWKELIEYLYDDVLYFTCVKDNPEDLITVEYLRDCAIQAGIKTDFIYLEDIGWDEHDKSFVDIDQYHIRNIFKLYPWEWIINEEFGDNLLRDVNNTIWIEPIWKMILSNKAILPILWKLYPNHKNLLPSYFTVDELNGFDYVKKPLLSREGANIEIVVNGKSVESSVGDYGEDGFIYQKFNSLPNFEGNYPVIGSWIIGGESAGIGIRETKTLITDNLSRFVPHLIKN